MFEKAAPAVLIPILVVCLYSSALALTVQLTSDKSEYVTREPVKLTVTLTNESPLIQHIIGVESLDWNMDYLYYEIINPNGVLEYRKFRSYMSHHESGYRDYGTYGEPLNPGESVLFFLYPNYTLCLDHKAKRYMQEGCTRITFKSPGTYRIQLVYSIPSEYVNLWKGTNGIVRSNQIELSFRPEDQEEREILDALWSVGSDFSTGDDGLLIRFDKGRLSEVLDKYPNHPLIKHVYFNLARQILCDGPRREVGRALDLLIHCRNTYPEYRSEEVSRHLAYAYHNLDQSDAANGEMMGAMRKNPLLKTNYPFMWLKILFDCGDVRAVSKWQEKRAKNEYRIEEEIQ